MLNVLSVAISRFAVRLHVTDCRKSPAGGGALLLVGQSSAGARSLSKWEGQRELCTIDIAAIGDCRLQMF